MVYDGPAVGPEDRAADRDLRPRVRRRVLGRSPHMTAATPHGRHRRRAWRWPGPAGCRPAARRPKPPGAPAEELVFSILSAENQASMAPLWQPLLDDMQKQIGPEGEAVLRHQLHLPWWRPCGSSRSSWAGSPPSRPWRRSSAPTARCSAASSMPAASDTYKSVLIVRKGSGMTLDKVLTCDKTLSFGMGDAQSTSGTLAPDDLSVHAQRASTRRSCFKTVRSASHQANAARRGQRRAGRRPPTTPSGLVFLRRESPASRRQGAR